MKKREQIARFWQQYRMLLQNAGVSPSQQRWYINHLERYITAKGSVKLVAVGPDQIADYLDGLSHHPTYPPWRLQQAVHALEILFNGLVQPDWALSLDWNHWKVTELHHDPLISAA